jgi:hypothetical protein
MLRRWAATTTTARPRAQQLACAEPLVLTTVDAAAFDTVSPPSPPSAFDTLQPAGHAPLLVSRGHLRPSLPLPTLHKATVVVAGLLVVAGAGAVAVGVGVGATVGVFVTVGEATGSLVTVGVTGVVSDWAPAPLMVMPEAA